MLACRALAKSFGGLAVTRDVSIQVPRGERHAIIGPNGAGKTTLFNLISGEIKADGGTILLDGVDVTRLSPDRRARLGLGRSFQRNACFAEMTVAQNLTVAAAPAFGLTWSLFRRVGRNRDLHVRVATVAEAVGVADLLDVPIAELSYGTQRQVEIGVALAGDPRLIMLDEPTAGMSPEETERIRALIIGLPRDLTLVIIEHDMDLLLSLVDRVTVLDRGQVLQQGTPDEIRRSELVQTRYLGGLAS